VQRPFVSTYDFTSVLSTLDDNDGIMTPHGNERATFVAGFELQTPYNCDGDDESPTSFSGLTYLIPALALLYRLPICFSIGVLC